MYILDKLACNGDVRDKSIAMTWYTAVYRQSSDLLCYMDWYNVTMIK